MCLRENNLLEYAQNHTYKDYILYIIELKSLGPNGINEINKFYVMMTGKCPHCDQYYKKLFRETLNGKEIIYKCMACSEEWYFTVNELLQTNLLKNLSKWLDSK